MIHLVYANRSNAGDWLSAIAIRRLLGEPVVEHLCDEPFVPETLARLAELAPEDLVVIGGGGLFHAYFTPFWRGVAALPEQVRICLWGLGLCDLKAEPSRVEAELARALLARSRLTVVRDDLTRDWLGGRDGGGALPEPIACPSLTAIERPSEPGHGLLLAVNLTTAGERAVAAMRQAASVFAVETGRPCRETSNRFEAGSRPALEATLDLYARSDVVLSSRLHGCLFAVAMGRRLLAVSGDWKIDAFLAQAGLSSCLVEERDPDAIARRLRDAGEPPDATGFLARVRARHLEVAAAVRAIHASDRTG